MRNSSGCPAAAQASTSRCGCSCVARNSSASPWSTSSGSFPAPTPPALAGVVGLPRLAVVAEVGGERLRPRAHARARRSARTPTRCGSGRDSRARWRARRGRHRMPADRTRIRRREPRFDQRRQFRDHVLVHAVMRGPRRARRIDGRTRALAEVVAVRIGHAFAARAGVRRDEGDAVLGRVTLRARPW